MSSSYSTGDQYRGQDSHIGGTVKRLYSLLERMDKQHPGSIGQDSLEGKFGSTKEGLPSIDDFLEDLSPADVAHVQTQNPQHKTRQKKRFSSKPYFTKPQARSNSYSPAKYNPGVKRSLGYRLLELVLDCVVTGVRSSLEFRAIKAKMEYEVRNYLPSKR